MSPVMLARFVRADTLGASITIVLVGAATSTRQLSFVAVPGLVALAVSFHLYAYLLNDVVDLPVDRTDPRRRLSPLVTGLVSRRFALVIALAQIPLLVMLVVWIDTGPVSLVTLGVLVVSVSVYDLWGKRCPVPPITDLVQGVAWASHAWLAAQFVGQATAWTVALGVYVVAFILLANGVHGSIRDLINDRINGARTTATWFGARVGPAGGVRVQGAYLVYALGLQGLTVAVALGPFALGWEQAGWIRLTATVVVGASSTVMLVVASRARERHRQLVVGAWHLILLLASVFLMVATRLPGWALAAAIGGYVLPFASYRWLFRPRPEPGTHWTVTTAPTR